MKTSASQFEAIVEFMERHGDLVKPGDGPAGRLRAVQLWTELAERLNLDVTGDTKTVDKWKKVWSDFKLNTKRKAAKIHQAALRTGGGPPCRLYLSDLEQRVLTLIGPQSATGLADVPEVGVEISQPPPVLTCSTDEITPTLSFSDIQIILPESDPRISSPRPTPRSPMRRPRSASRSPSRSRSRRPGSPLGRPGSSQPRARPALRSPLRPPRSPVQRPRSKSRSPLRRSRSVSRSPLRRPGSPLRRARHASLSPLQRTIPQRTAPRRNTSSRTNPRPTTARSSQLDDVSARFVAQDQHWRDIFREYAREQARLRERELEQQAIWQNLAREYTREQVRLRERELEQQAIWQNLARDGVDLLRQLFLNN